MIFTARKTFCLIALLLLCRLVANCFLPVFDPSEARYACVCANMATSGNFLEPQFVNNGVFETFEGKPPLYFQMGAICCKLFGIHEFAVRIPAMASAVGILLLIYFTVKKLRDEQTASLATLLAALSPVFLAFSGFCMTDLLLALTICGAVCMYALFLAEPERRRKKIYSLGFFASMGVGMIVKGPVAIVMAGLPIFLFTVVDRRWRDLKEHAWFGGIALFLLIAAPWYVLMQMKNPDFLEYFFINENCKRFLFKEYGDRYGAGRETFRGMALIFMLLCNLPALAGAILLWKRRSKKVLSCLGDPLTGMALLWLLANTFFWCLTSRVLITYLLPTMPAAAIVIADGFARCGFLEDPVKKRRIYRVSCILCALFSVICLASCRAMPPMRNNAGHFFAELAGKYAGQKFYFVKKTPHSAEFYMGKSVCHHPDESRNRSAECGKEYILLATGRDLEVYGDSLRRKVIDHYGDWYVLAPEEK